MVHLSDPWSRFHLVSTGSFPNILVTNIDPYSVMAASVCFDCIIKQLQRGKKVGWTWNINEYFHVSIN